MLTERERIVLAELNEWEKQLFAKEQSNTSIVFNQWLEQSFQKLPEDVQEKFLQTVDESLFQLQAIIQSSQFRNNSEQRILANGRRFNEHINDIADLNKLTFDQLQYIAKEQISRHRLYSLFQGSLTGTGQTLFATIDIPALAIINIRVIQLISLSYGYQLNSPFNMVATLKCFQGAMLPDEWKKAAWSDLINHLEESEDRYFHGGTAKVTSVQWLQQPLKQLLKLLTINLFKNRRIQNIPVISIALGAGMNYKLTKDITDFSDNYYKYRYLLERQGG